MAKHTLQELKQWQALPLDLKIRMTETRVRGWINEYGEDGVYISFSGGKDSTVLMDIVRNRMGYNVPAVFVDVPTQFPELRDFAKTWDNVEIIRPKISFMQVCEQYGFPLISKEASDCVAGAKKYLESITESEKQSELEKKVKYHYFYDKLMGNGNYNKSKQPSDTFGNKDRSMFSQEKWKFFLEAPFDINNKCCSVMKKDPLHRYNKETGRRPITAQMADESRLRTQQWLLNGCNGFEMKSPISNPMSFWTEQDVLEYIAVNKLPICSVYGDVVKDYGEQVDGQISLVEEKDKYKTTGCSRTGCMLCGFGCHLEKEGEGRFEILKESHPKMYNLLDVCKNNGVTFREAIEWTNEHGDLNIRL